MDLLSAIERKILALKAELSQLEAKRLKLIASKEMDTSVSNESLSPEQKVQLFQSYFIGNSTCYVVRWQNIQGRSGYSLACNNEWQQELGSAISRKLNALSVLTSRLNLLIVVVVNKFRTQI